LNSRPQLPFADRSPIPAWKRVLDIVCIVTTFPGWLLVGVFVAVLIKLTSVGPIFFRQQRIGYRGRPFSCFKFRTMKANAETDVHRGHFTQLMTSDVPMTKLDAKGDSRLIPSGLFLRALGLDELPQLINVLRGEMSLVGPRPCLPYEYEGYRPRHRQRFHAVPGLTGLWQISGKNRTTFEEMIDLDIHYATHKSLLLDLKILICTLPAICGQVTDLKQSQESDVKTSTENNAAGPDAIKKQPGRLEPETSV
jgi:lipopolysaccharide/colanic/teichoic acid biosynthesis glycosyltransferase